MSVIEEGKNAWRVVRSSRVAFLVDGAAYFEAIADAFEKARRSIYIVGWDFNSDIVLRRHGGASSSGARLRDLLQAVLEERPDLHVYVLIWDFSMLYTFERDLLPLFDVAWSSGPRLHFHMDDAHALGGCHHQKVVVVDEAVAFVGGFDLTKCRWDTPQHKTTDEGRVDPGGHAYLPFHDVQMAVEGSAARALAELARDRWSRATGDEIAGADTGGEDLWPTTIAPDAEDVDVGIIRTWPALAGRDEIREIERLYVDAIAAAERFIYLENQYFTSSTIVDALVARLEDAAGPEIVAVFPLKCSGWLEEKTMGLLRIRALDRLLGAQGAGRFRAYYPALPDSGNVFVHSKVIIVDDQFLMIGSANLSNRSMGLDSECNLAMESSADGKTPQGIANLRSRLLAEHLGTSVSEVSKKLDETGSLAKAIEELRGKERTLEKLEPEDSEWTEALATTVSAVDPERPIDPEKLVEQLVPTPEPRASRPPTLRWLGVALAVLTALAVLWRWTALGEAVDRGTLTEWLTLLEKSPMTPLLIVLGYVLASLLMVPMTVLIVVTALAFTPLTAMFYAISGAMASATVGFGLGHVLGKDSIRRLAGSRLNRLSKRLARSGLVTMTAARLLPIAPFTVVNLVAGASHIRFWDFILGSFLGLLPGICAVTILKHRLEGVLRNPTPSNILLFAGVAVVVVLGALWVRRRFGSRNPEETLG